MINIIRKGKVKKNAKIYSTTCSNCKAEFEYDFSEVNFEACSDKPRVACPTKNCKHFIPHFEINNVNVPHPLREAREIMLAVDKIPIGDRGIYNSPSYIDKVLTKKPQ